MRVFSLWFLFLTVTLSAFGSDHSGHEVDFWSLRAQLSVLPDRDAEARLLELSQRADLSERDRGMLTVTAAWRSFIQYRQSRWSEQGRRKQNEARAILLELSQQEERREGGPTAAYAAAQEALMVFQSELWGVWNEGASGPMLHARNAAAYWAQSTDLEYARTRYLRLVLEIPEHPHILHRGATLEAYLRSARDLVQNALRLTDDPEWLAQLRWKRARLFLRETNKDLRDQAGREYVAAVDLAPDSAPWLPDLLLSAAHYFAEGTPERDPEQALVFTRRYFLVVGSNDPSQRSRQAVQLHQQLSQPTGRIWNQPGYQAGQAHAIPVIWKGKSSVEIRLDSLQLEHSYLERIADSDRAQTIQQRVWTGVEASTAPTPNAWSTGVVTLGPDLKPGAYQLSLVGNGFSVTEVFIISEYGLVMKRAGNHVLIHAAHAFTGEPLADVELEVALVHWERRVPTLIETIRTRTDESGMLSLKNLVNADQRGNGLEVLLPEPYVARASIGIHYTSEDPDTEIIGFTDRPVYRPGEVVHWKAILRELNRFQFRTPASGQVIRYVIANAFGDEVKEGTLETNEWGTVWDSFELPLHAVLGEYEIHLIWEQEYLGVLNFQVEEFRPPEFRVSVAFEGTPYRMGDTIEGNVNVNYYSGEPIPGARVSLKIREQEDFFDIRWPGFRPWSRGVDADRVFVPSEVFRGDLVTDGEGKVRFSFESSIARNHNLRYVLELSVTDLAGRVIQHTTSTIVGRHRSVVGLSIERELVASGGSSRINVISTAADGSPLSAEGIVRLFRFHPAVDCERELARKEVDTKTVSTSDKGEATVDWGVLAAGAYVVTWEGADSEALGEALFYVGEPENQPVEKESKLILDERPYAVDSVVPALLLTDGTPQYAFVWIGNWEFFEWLVIPLNGTATYFELRARPEFGQEVQVGVELFANGFARSLRKTLTMDNLPPPLQVEVLVSEKTVRPGAEGLIEVQVLDADGAPVPNVELSLTVFDEALSVFGNVLPVDTVSPETFLRYHQFSSIQNANSVGLGARAYQYIRRYSEHFHGYDEDLAFELSPFELSADATVGYRATDTLAVSRIRTVLTEIGAAVSGVTQQVLHDFGAMNRSDLLQYTAAIEEGGLTGAWLSPPTFTPKLRQDFRRSAIWVPSIMTDVQGRAKVPSRWPDSLTEWRMQVIAVGKGAQIGGGESSVRTALPLTARLQLPRFLVEGDEAQLSIVASNHSGEDLEIEQRLEFTSPLQGRNEIQRQELASGQQARADWRVVAEAPGTSLVKATVVSGKEGDAMILPLEIIEHGFEQLITRSGLLQDNENTVTLQLPDAHKPGSADLTVSLSAGITPWLLDALPYLVEFPYHCLEQSVSRLIPMEWLLEHLQEEGAARDELLARLGFANEDAYESFQMITLERIGSVQHHDGGWGWFSSEYPSPFMTAYAYWMLNLVPDNERLESGNHYNLTRAGRYLESVLPDFERRPWMSAWILHALSIRFEYDDSSTLGRQEEWALQKLYKQRASLSPSTLALTALVAARAEREDLVEGLRPFFTNGLIEAVAPGTGTRTAHWGERSGFYLSWGEQPIEATALMIMALQAVDPSDPLIEPAVEWLLAERASSRWESTLSTAISIVALEKYRRNTQPIGADSVVRIIVNGQEMESVRLSGAEVLQAGKEWSFPSQDLMGGDYHITVQTEGDLPVRYSVSLAFKDQRTRIPAAQSGIDLQRNYYSVVRQPTLAAGPRLAYQLLTDGDAVQAGDLIEVRLVIETGMTLSYLMLEDFKPAGFESTELNSGFSQPARELQAQGPLENAAYTGASQWVYLEPRDKLRALFLDRLPPGIWEIRYQLRAETPGSFHALPAKMEAMYTPRTRGNSDETLLRIE